jgi:hypothetical protein
MPYKDRARKNARRRELRAAARKARPLADVPLNDLDLSAPALNEPSHDPTPESAHAIEHSFAKATRPWDKANPVRSSKKAKGWGDDLRPITSVSQKNEREFDDERRYREPGLGGKKRTAEFEDEEHASSFGTPVAVSSEGTPALDDEAPTFRHLTTDSRTDRWLKAGGLGDGSNVHRDDGLTIRSVLGLKALRAAEQYLPSL